MRELSTLYHMMHNDPRTRSLKKFMEELGPFVRHKAVLRKHMLSVENERLWSVL